TPPFGQPAPRGARSLRIPSRLAHRARPIRQYRDDATLSRLLPSSPATPGLDFLQLHPTAATARRWRYYTSIRNISASWRTQAASSFTPPLRRRGDGRSLTSIRNDSASRRTQTITRMERATATRALSLPIRFASRRYRSPRKVPVLAAAAAASPRAPLREGLPLPVLPERFFGPDWMVRGDSFARGARGPAGGKTLMSRPFSARTTCAVCRAMPGISSRRAIADRTAASGLSPAPGPGAPPALPPP